MDRGQRVPRVWDWYARYGATPEAMNAAHAHLHSHAQWWSELPDHVDLTVNAVEALVHLNTNQTVYFVTARPHTTHGYTHLWLEETGLDTPQVIVTPTRKVPALIALEPRAIIEDNAETLREFRWAMHAMKLPPCELILVDRPYNREGDLTGLTLVTSTHAALQVVKGLPRV